MVDICLHTFISPLSAFWYFLRTWFLHSLQTALLSSGWPSRSPLSHPVWLRRSAEAPTLHLQGIKWCAGPAVLNQEPSPLHVPCGIWTPLWNSAIVIDSVSLKRVRRPAFFSGKNDYNTIIVTAVIVTVNTPRGVTEGHATSCVFHRRSPSLLTLTT